GRCWCSFCFQGEDGIRRRTVTGVQTCALPIWLVKPIGEHERVHPGRVKSCCYVCEVTEIRTEFDGEWDFRHDPRRSNDIDVALRSEERRVGKECIRPQWPES